VNHEPATGAAAAGDREIRAKLLAELNGREWARVWPEEIIGQDGVVHLWIADIRPAAERGVLRVAAENVPGVRSVGCTRLKTRGISGPARRALRRRSSVLFEEDRQPLPLGRYAGVCAQVNRFVGLGRQEFGQSGCRKRSLCGLL